MLINIIAMLFVLLNDARNHNNTLEQFTPIHKIHCSMKRLTAIYMVTTDNKLLSASINGFFPCKLVNINPKKTVVSSSIN